MSSENEEKLSPQARKLVARIHQYFDEEQHDAPGLSAPPAAPGGGDALRRCAEATGLPENIISQVILHKSKTPSQDQPYVLDLNDRFAFQKDRLSLISTAISSKHKSLSAVAHHRIPNYISGIQSNIKEVQKRMNCYEDKTGCIFVDKTKYRLKLINYLRFSKGAVSQHLVYTFVGELVCGDMSYMVAFAALGDHYLSGSLVVRPLAPRAQDDIYDFVLRDLESSWLSTKVIPKGGSDSVIIIMNESVYKKALRSAPGARSGAAAMRRWLATHGVPAPAELRAPQLYELVRRHKASFVETEYGVRLYKVPDYLPYLNHLDIFWHDNIGKIVNLPNSEESLENTILDLLDNAIRPKSMSMSKRLYNVFKAEYALLEQQECIDILFKDNKFENCLETESESETSDDEDNW